MQNREHVSYNALILHYKGDYERLKKIFSVNGSWGKALEKANISAAAANSAWTELQKNGVRLILNADKEFPESLKHIPWPPFALYAKGETLEDKNPKIAIVGTRAATMRGGRVAEDFGKALAQSSITVVSGLALGIDARAHKGSISGGGKTIAVLAHGLEKTYPRQNENLGKEIISSGGTLLSEYPLGSPSLPRRFIERNRIISGLALGVIVIEAPASSGALATARFAVEQNRDVFVIPGALDDPHYEGSHALIKSGAALVTSSSEVLENLGIETKKQKTNVSFNNSVKLDENQKAVINVLQAAGEKIDVDTIAERSSLDIPSAIGALSFLIIKKIAKEEDGRYYI